MKDINGVKSEPYEELIIDTPDEFTGVIIEKLGKRKAVMSNMTQKNGLSRLTFDIPTPRIARIPKHLRSRHQGRRNPLKPIRIIPAICRSDREARGRIHGIHGKWQGAAFRARIA